MTYHTAVKVPDATQSGELDEVVVKSVRSVNPARTVRSARWWLWFNAAALFGLWVLFTFVGEQWWPVAYLLYVPRMVWALPLLAIVTCRLGRSRSGRAVDSRRDLLPLGLAVALLLGPLGGFRWSFGVADTPGGARKLRVLSQNVHSFPKLDAFVTELSRLQPDLVLLQEATGWSAEWWENVAPQYEWRLAGEHVFGSKYPVVQVVDHWRTGYVRYEVSVDGEPLDVISIHPPSLQFAVRHVLGFRSEGEPRQWADMNPLEVINHDWQRRLDALAAVRGEIDVTRPMIIGGDTNFTHGSWAMHEYFEGVIDAFDAAGRGFGYTFPERAPWLRLDRVMVTARLRVVAIDWTNAVASDHRGLVVDVELLSTLPRADAARDNGPRGVLPATRLE